MSEIQELRAECSGYKARLEKIKSATNHVTPEEKEKVGNAFVLSDYNKPSYEPGEDTTDVVFLHLLYSLVIHCSYHFNLQVYKERNVYVKEWKKRKRLVMYIELQ